VTDVLYHSDPNVDLAIITTELGRQTFGDHGADLPPKREKLGFIPLPSSRPNPWPT
jgi:hypothetical protein